MALPKPDKTNPEVAALRAEIDMLWNKANELKIKAQAAQSEDARVLAIVATKLEEASLWTTHAG